MNLAPLVLDAAGLDALTRKPPPAWLRARLTIAAADQREVICPTVVCAEVARTRSRTRSLEAVVARHDRARGERPMLRLIDTDFSLARQIGAILEAAGRGSEHIVDAHVIAVCVAYGGGLIVTSDPDDILTLADTVPAARIRVIQPS